MERDWERVNATANVKLLLSWRGKERGSRQRGDGQGGANTEEEQAHGGGGGSEKKTSVGGGGGRGFTIHRCGIDDRVEGTVPGHGDGVDATTVEAIGEALVGTHQ
jgi:hypothetical protein